MFIIGIAISVVSGLFTAAWGAYKDAPIEGFHARSFWRSVVFSVGTFAIAWTALDDRVAHLYSFQLFFFVMGVERIAIEIYKPCFRREDQGRYLIPQDGSFLGYRVEARWLLVSIGAVLVAATFGVMALGTEIASFGAHAAVAITVGLFICCGGAAKDAPFEGFQRRKFLRSAIVLALASPLLYLLGPTP